VSIITYGILWKWISNVAEGSLSPIYRYGSFFLDEFADLGPKEEMAARTLGSLLQGGRLWSEVRIAVAGFGVSSAYVESLLGQHSFLKVDGRFHDMYRCIVACNDGQGDVLELAACLAAAALSRPGLRSGAVIVFLPGMAEIRRVESFLRNGSPKVRVSILHSDCIGCEEEEDVALGAEDLSPHAILSTIVGARSVTYYNLKYAIIHPAMRAEVLGPSGLSRMTDRPLSEELQGNMAGRVARTHPGVVTYLYDFDDSEVSLQSLAARSSFEQVIFGDSITVVLGPPSRLYLVLGTMRYLRQRGFPNVYWFRTLETADLDVWAVRPNGRVMACWASVVLPGLMLIIDGASKRVPKKFHIVEDTTILSPGVSYAQVAESTAFSEAGIWGYGKFVKSTSSSEPSWFGTKGMSVDASWCTSMQVVLANTRSAQLKH